MRPTMPRALDGCPKNRWAPQSPPPPLPPSSFSPFLSLFLLHVDVRAEAAAFAKRIREHARSYFIFSWALYANCHKYLLNLLEKEPSLCHCKERLMFTVWYLLSVSLLHCFCLRKHSTAVYGNNFLNVCIFFLIFFTNFSSRFTKSISMKISFLI